jgi:hypothetical protein
MVKNAQAKASRVPRGAGAVYRRALVALTMTGIAVAGTACSGSRAPNRATAATAPAGSNASAQQARNAALVKFAACVRSHGVSNFPDPSGGFLSVPQGLDPKLVVAASRACRSLLPNGGPGQASNQQSLAGLAKFAACMTKHGVPISVDGQGSLSFPDNVDPNSRQFQGAQHACQGLTSGGTP